MLQGKGKPILRTKKSVSIWFAFAASTVPSLKGYWFFSGVFLFF